MAKKIHYVPRYARDDLKDGEKKIEAFLTHLAVNKNVFPSTQQRTTRSVTTTRSALDKGQIGHDLRYLLL